MNTFFATVCVFGSIALFVLWGLGNAYDLG